MRITILHSLTAKQALLVAGAFSAAMLTAAFIAQFGFSLHPCELCLLQRYPYAAIIAVAGLSWWRAKTPNRQRFALLLCALLFAVDAGIAVYHTGVEYGWFPGPDACSSTATAGMSLEEMRKQLLDAPLVSCSQAMMYFFGLSMAAWNAIAALLATLGTLMIWRNRR
jgi:disulfide bond formation protein DsbB